MPCRRTLVSVLAPATLALTALACARASSSDPAAATPAAAATKVYVVRHAERASATDRDSPLSAAGAERARALAAVLADSGIAGVILTQYRRTQETAAPLARARGLTPEVVAVAGPVEEHAAAVARLVRERYAGRSVLVVGHSNTVSAIIAALGAPRLPDLCDAAYANLFAVTLDGAAAPRVARSSFGAPDPPAAANCPGMSPR
jgi:broad specificity phosphatase PhoE